MVNENVRGVHFTLGIKCYGNKRSKRFTALGKGKMLMGLSDIIEVLNVRNPFYKLGHLKAWHISIPVSHPYHYYVCILKD